MDIIDSTAYEPLKEAQSILINQKDSDPALRFYSNYYMGIVHRENRNYYSAIEFFQRALSNAKLSSNSTQLFDIYLKLFWIKMTEEDLEKSKLYLDTLTTYASTTDDKYFLLNAESVYYDNLGEYEKALQKEKDQLRLSKQLKKSPEYYKIFYSISERYNNLNILDSALFYANKSIANIEDSTYRLNYLLYQNAADIAEKMQKYDLANEYSKKALKAYDVSVNERLDTKIIELEKRYNHAETENQALKSRNRFRIILAVSTICILIAIIIILFLNKKRIAAQLKQTKLIEERNRIASEKQQADMEVLLSREQAENQKILLSRYNSILKLHVDQQQNIIKMANKVRSKNPELGDAYDEMIKIGQQQFNELLGELFTTEDLQRLFDIKDESQILGETDRLFLIMLANNATNDEIAALLNTTPTNLKAKKYYLKKKIISNSTQSNGFDRLLQLF